MSALYHPELADFMKKCYHIFLKRFVFHKPTVTGIIYTKMGTFLLIVSHSRPYIVLREVSIGLSSL